MKKNITFEKKIDFPTMVGEITSVSLEHNLKFIDEYNIEGKLLLVGKYKLTEASRLEEDFNFDIPIEISLSEKIDLNTSEIEISDFYYELENNNTMICHIELLVEGDELLEINDEDIDENDRECDGDDMKEIEIPILKDINEESSMSEDDDTLDDVIENKRNESLFINLNDDSDTYGTFSVYIVRQNESINSIIEKYHTTIEELQKYNDVNNINIGTKLIIPYKNER